MGVDDYHVSTEVLDKLEAQLASPDYKLKRVEEVAYKWFDGQISDRRMAETVFGLINTEVRK